ncbi:MAG: CHAT domain-containing protein, partial [Spirochaetia bacterium]|nr:CHAT domain-containing protein [Spirochaetia bacterium]
MNLERKEILEYWSTNNISYKELKGASCTRARFIEKIASVRVLHYSGHSFEDGLWFSDISKLEISDLSSLNLSNLELVSLNSCSSAIGLARGFLEAGAKECVGFLGPVR